MLRILSSCALLARVLPPHMPAYTRTGTLTTLSAPPPVDANLTSTAVDTPRFPSPVLAYPHASALGAIAPTLTMNAYLRPLTGGASVFATPVLT